MKKVHENKEKKKKEAREHGDGQRDNSEYYVNWDMVVVCCTLKTLMYCVLAAFILLTIFYIGAGGCYIHENKYVEAVLCFGSGAVMFLTGVVIWCSIVFGHEGFWFIFISLDLLCCVCAFAYAIFSVLLKSEPTEEEIDRIAFTASISVFVFTLLLIWTMAAAVFAFWRFRRSDWKRFDEKTTTIEEV